MFRETNENRRRETLKASFTRSTAKSHTLCTIPMIALIAFIWLGGCCIASAAVPPPSPSTSWGRMNNESYRRNEDIPIMGDHFLRRGRKDSESKPDRKIRRRFKRSKTRDEDRIDEALFFLDQDSDDIHQFERHHQTYYDRRRRRRKGKNNQHLDSFRSWALDKTGVHIPRVNVYFDPITILKLRKSWHYIPGVIILLGADFQPHRLGGGLWRIRGCIEDKFLGGRFTIKERRTQQHNGNDEDDDRDDRSILVEYSKSWLFAGAGTIGTRFKLSAAYDITNKRGSARFGFKAENTDAVGSYTQLLPGRKGLSIVPIIPLDIDRRFLLETKANVNLPEPEFVIGTDFDGTSDGGLLGMGIGGDIDVEVEELNLICSF